jgi:hypothetical protein
MKYFKWILPLALACSSHAAEGQNSVYAVGEYMRGFVRTYDFSAAGNLLQYPTMSVATGEVKYAELELRPYPIGEGACHVLRTMSWAQSNVDTRIWAADASGNYISLDDDSGREGGSMSPNYYSSQAAVWVRAGGSFKTKVRVAVYDPTFNTSNFRLLVDVAVASSEAQCAGMSNGHVIIPTAAYTETGIRFYGNN